MTVEIVKAFLLAFGILWIQTNDIMYGLNITAYYLSNLNILYNLKNWEPYVLQSAFVG